MKIAQRERLQTRKSARDHAVSFNLAQSSTAHHRAGAWVSAGKIDDYRVLEATSSANDKGFWAKTI